MNIRSKLYTAAKILGDVNAIRRGRVLQRIHNRIVWKLLGKIGRKLSR